MFDQPGWLWLLLAMPLVMALPALAARRRRRTWRALGQHGKAPGDGGIAWVVMMAPLVIALAEPRWGSVGGEPQPGRDVVLMIDVSRSMGAEDVVPDRLGAAAEAANGLIEALGREPGDRAAVVAFAGRGLIRCPLTANLGAASEAIEGLRPGTIEPGGTDLGAGLDAAIDAFDDQARAGGRVVVVLSDGEDHDPSWSRHLPRLDALGAIVHTVAFGDDEQGHPIPIDASEGDRPRFVEYRGEVVHSLRSDDALRALALATRGAFVPIGLAEADLGMLYEQRIAPADRRARRSTRAPERRERYALFVVAALAVGLIGSWPRRTHRATGAGHRRLLAALAITVAAIGADGGPETPREAVEAGRAAFGRGDFEDARAAFERAGKRSPGGPIVPYNLGATLYQLGRFDEARDRYLDADRTADPGLRMKIDYALGNVAVARRAIPEALQRYDACLAAKVDGAAFDRIRGFAVENRAFAERLIPPEATLADVDGGGPDDPGSEGRPDGPDDRQNGGGPPPGPSGASGMPGNPGGQDGTDGVGGAGPGPPGSDGGQTPSERLSDALESIREARDRRPEAPPTASEGRSDRRDW